MGSSVGVSTSGCTGQQLLTLYYRRLHSLERRKYSHPIQTMVCPPAEALSHSPRRLHLCPSSLPPFATDPLPPSRRKSLSPPGSPSCQDLSAAPAPQPREEPVPSFLHQPRRARHGRPGPEPHLAGASQGRVRRQRQGRREEICRRCGRRLCTRRRRRRLGKQRGAHRRRAEHGARREQRRPEGWERREGPVVRSRRGVGGLVSWGEHGWKVKSMLLPLAVGREGDGRRSQPTTCGEGGQPTRKTCRYA